jgi:hypothetical protein
VYCKTDPVAMLKVSFVSINANIDKRSLSRYEFATEEDKDIRGMLHENDPQYLSDILERYDRIEAGSHTFDTTVHTTSVKQSMYVQLMY